LGCARRLDAPSAGISRNFDLDGQSPGWANCGFLKNESCAAVVQIACSGFRAQTWNKNAPSRQDKNASILPDFAQPTLRDWFGRTRFFERLNRQQKTGKAEKWSLLPTRVIFLPLFFLPKRDG